MEIVSNIQEKKSNERAITFNRFSNIWVNQIIKAMWPWTRIHRETSIIEYRYLCLIAKYLCALVCLSLYPSMSPDAKYEIHLHLELQEGI